MCEYKWLLLTNIEGVRAKNLQATLLFVDFTKAFDSIHRGKMEQILLAYGLPKETVAAIMILYRNTKVKVRSPDGDTEYFDIVAGVLQGDTLALYLFIICLDYMLRTSRWSRISVLTAQHDDDDDWFRWSLGWRYRVFHLDCSSNWMVKNKIQMRVNSNLME